MLLCGFDKSGIDLRGGNEDEMNTSYLEGNMHSPAACVFPFCFQSAVVDSKRQQEVNKEQKGFRKEIQGQLRELESREKIHQRKEIRTLD